MHNATKVLLPGWIFDQAEDQEELKQSILKYMERYPGYTILSVKDGFAVCEIDR